MTRLTTIGFDADDTLRETEAVFRLTRARVVALLADRPDPAHPAGRREAAGRPMPGACGVGITGFVLSMIETAIEAG